MRVFRLLCDFSVKVRSLHVDFNLMALDFSWISMRL